MFRCPLCGASARIRTSRPEMIQTPCGKSITSVTILECGVCFSTLEAFHKFTSKHASGVHFFRRYPVA
ncbi:Ogr/Delta-like zinc finger [Escherichia coli]|nr:Ogr/Delta-like zinc finger [Escherichia coli]